MGESQQALVDRQRWPTGRGGRAEVADRLRWAGRGGRSEMDARSAG